jgi:hypothetical protein
MRRYWGIAAVIFVLPCLAQAAITRVATFENFNEGDSFEPSFTDLLSGITFHDSTHANGGFTIEFSGTEFGGGNYLSAGGYAPGPGHSWAGNFGFVGDLPSLAQRVSVDVTHSVGDTSSIKMRAFDADGNLLMVDSAPMGAPPNFVLTVTSRNFAIARFQLQGGAAIATGYDNISYEIVPEPGLVSGLLGIGALSMRRRR